MKSYEKALLLFGFVIAIVCGEQVVRACPFCVAAGQTLREEIDAADVALLVQLVYLPNRVGPNEADPAGLAAIDPDSGMAKFTILEIVKGKNHVAGIKEIETTFLGEPKKEAVFLITGLGTAPPQWTTPTPLGKVAQNYIRKLPGLPADRIGQLRFFQDYLESDDPMLAQDAYDEFARAPYKTVATLKQYLDHDQLVEWVKDTTIPPSRRRLYLVMLGVCGDSKDVATLETMIRDDDTQMRNALDSIIGCYLTLKGADGLPLIEELFLKNSDANYKDTYSAVMALRFHGQETDVIPRERLLVSMRYLLDHPDLADQVINDLTRWEDWSVMDRLVALFKSEDEDARWTREPVVQYLQVCARQDNETGRKAQRALEELTQLDPETVKRAQSYFAFGGFAGARANTTAPPPAPTPTAGEANTTVADVAAAEDKTVDGATDSSKDRSDNTESADQAAGRETKKTRDAGPIDESKLTKPPVDSAANKSHRGADRAAIDVSPAAESTAAGRAGQPEPPSRLVIVAVPLVGGAALIALYWIILRGAG